MCICIADVVDSYHSLSAYFFPGWNRLKFQFFLVNQFLIRLLQVQLAVFVIGVNWLAFFSGFVIANIRLCFSRFFFFRPIYSTEWIFFVPLWKCNFILKTYVLFCFCFVAEIASKSLHEEKKWMSTPRNVVVHGKNCYPCHFRRMFHAYILASQIFYRMLHHVNGSHMNGNTLKSTICFSTDVAHMKC